VITTEQTVANTGLLIKKVEIDSSMDRNEEMKNCEDVT
jgi:hypothetical protein